MKIALRDTEAFVRNLRARMPFRYGIVTMTQTPHFILRASVEIDGRVWTGYASDNLPPKWLTKDPSTAYVDDLRDMLEVIAHARAAAEKVGGADSVFDFWQKLYAAQKSWAGSRFPPLLWNFGVTLLERVVIDAFCRARQIPFARAVRENLFGVRLGEIFPELTDCTPGALLPAQPLRSTIIRHTVGLTDPLTEQEVPPADRPNDGLPEALETYFRVDGITHLKIKLGGTVEGDLERLHRIVRLVESVEHRVFFTLDGNENFKAVEPFRRLWESLRADPVVARFLEGLIFVEQPFHRDVALAPETCAELRAWAQRPPMIIDESDSGIGVLLEALEGGYVGTSHKNCKGIFKGLANTCLLQLRRRAHPEIPYQMSAEDLTNIGPIALPEDLAVLASYGIEHAERNGHHYFAGLNQFPKAVQQEVLRVHPDLYEEHPAGFPTLRIRNGRIAIGSAIDAPFGLPGDIDFSEIDSLETWTKNSLASFR